MHVTLRGAVGDGFAQCGSHGRLRVGVTDVNEATIEEVSRSVFSKKSFNA